MYSQLPRISKNLRHNPYFQSTNFEWVNLEKMHQALSLKYCPQFSWCLLSFAFNIELHSWLSITSSLKETSSTNNQSTARGRKDPKFPYFQVTAKWTRIQKTLIINPALSGSVQFHSKQLKPFRWYPNQEIAVPTPVRCWNLYSMCYMKWFSLLIAYTFRYQIFELIVIFLSGAKAQFHVSMALAMFKFHHGKYAAGQKLKVDCMRIEQRKYL